jgi:hypothetical protein
MHIHQVNQCIGQVIVVYSVYVLFGHSCEQRFEVAFCIINKYLTKTQINRKPSSPFLSVNQVCTFTLLSIQWVLYVIIGWYFRNSAKTPSSHELLFEIVSSSWVVCCYPHAYNGSP